MWRGAAQEVSRRVVEVADIVPGNVVTMVVVNMRGAEAYLRTLPPTGNDTDETHTEELTRVATDVTGAGGVVAVANISRYLGG